MFPSGYACYNNSNNKLYLESKDNICSAISTIVVKRWMLLHVWGAMMAVVVDVLIKKIFFI